MLIKSKKHDDKIQTTSNTLNIFKLINQEIRKKDVAEEQHQEGKVKLADKPGSVVDSHSSGP
jgi:hypothetical protein